MALKLQIRILTFHILSDVIVETELLLDCSLGQQRPGKRFGDGSDFVQAIALRFCTIRLIPASVVVGIALSVFQHANRYPNRTRRRVEIILRGAVDDGIDVRCFGYGLLSVLSFRRHPGNWTAEKHSDCG